MTTTLFSLGITNRVDILRAGTKSTLPTCWLYNALQLKNSLIAKKGDFVEV